MPGRFSFAVAKRRDVPAHCFGWTHFLRPVIMCIARGELPRRPKTILVRLIYIPIRSMERRRMVLISDVAYRIANVTGFGCDIEM
jgi:hypothetical protein